MNVKCVDKKDYIDHFHHLYWGVNKFQFASENCPVIAQK